MYGKELGEKVVMKREDCQAIQLDKQAIVEEIKKEIREKGYGEKTLNFHDVRACTDSQYSYDKVEFEEQVKILNALYYIPLDREEQTGNFLKRYMQKIVKKLVRFYFEPVVNEQVRYNAKVTQAMNQIHLYHLQLQQDMDEINERQRIATYDMTKRIQTLEKELVNIKTEMKMYQDENISRGNGCKEED